MSVRLSRVLAAGVALALLAAAAPIAQAQEVRNARRLGGSTSFHRPPLANAAALKRMATRPRMQADIRNVLEQGGVAAVSDEVLQALTNPRTVVTGASCAEATPEDGTLVECDFPVGGTLEWMAYKPKRKPSLIRNLRWAGRRPFKAFLFRVTKDDTLYTFIVPKVCGNLSLVSKQDIAKPPVQIAADRACAPDGTLTVTVRASGDLSRVARVRVAIDGTPAGELVGPSWSLTVSKPGTYTFEAVGNDGKPYPMARPSISIAPCPPPPPPPPQLVGPVCSVTLSAARVKGGIEIAVDASGSQTGTSEVAPSVVVSITDPAGNPVGERITLDASLKHRALVKRNVRGVYKVSATVTTPRSVVAAGKKYEGSATCEATIDAYEQAKLAAGTPEGAFFFDGLVGKERREREFEAGDFDPTFAIPAGFEYGQCSPLLGLKFGYAKRLDNDWELAGSAGVGISLVTDDDKLNESALYIDAEANKYFDNGMFFGGGITFWDLTRSDSFTPGLLTHFGVPLNKDAKVPVFFIGEGRLFFDGIDSIDNNYLFWGGLRIQFPVK